MPIQENIPAGQALWSEEDRDKYANLDFYLAATAAPKFKTYNIYQRMFSPMKWTPNMSDIVKVVHKEPSPYNRTEVLPQVLSAPPKKDVFEVFEPSNQAQIYRHRFESKLINFLPSFRDFLTDSVDFVNNDMTAQISNYVNLFYRTALFHGAKYVISAGASLDPIAAAHWTGPTITLAKTAAERAAIIAATTKPFSGKFVSRLCDSMQYDMAVEPYQGMPLGDGESAKGVEGKYLVVVSGEAYGQLPYDSFVQANKALNTDYSKEGFTGDWQGRATFKLERYPIRMTADGAFVAPETRQVNVNDTEYNETIINSAYRTAPYEVGFIFGADLGQALSVGAPPKEFAGGEMDKSRFQGMDWNGKVRRTRNVLVPSLDENGAVVMDTNKYGENEQLIAQAVMGMIYNRRRACVPFFYQRSRVAID